MSKFTKGLSVTTEMEKIMIDYWDAAYIESSTRISQADNANDCLHRMRVLLKKHDAAPDLYEALEAMLKCPSGQYGTDDSYDIACEKARAAIAKANGEVK